jgi:hypothetical protein
VIQGEFLCVVLSLAYVALKKSGLAEQQEEVIAELINTPH